MHNKFKKNLVYFYIIMNIKIFIIIFLLFIIYHIYYKKNENFELTDTEINNFIQNISMCNSNNDSIKFNNIETNKITINSNEISQYLLDICYPVGSFYVQYPDISSNYLTKAFPATQSPELLFGGKWTEKFINDAIFFRTAGGSSNESRATTGIQDYAMINITGNTSWTQTNYNSVGGGNDGIFDVNTGEIKTDSDGGNDTGVRNYFDSSVQSISSDQEIRVKNRIVKIWTRVS